jgi:DNA-binding NarL/FixJ family response regulator
MTASSPIRVVLVDDHAVVRGGVARVLERARGFDVVGEAADGPAAVARVREARPDVCVLDLDMPGGGLALIERLLDAHPGLRVLVLSQHAERDYALRCLEAGAHGYLAKTSPFEAIEEAVRRVGGGQRYLSEAAHELALDRLTGRPGNGAHRQLSSRELEIVRLLARGLRNADIAAELGVSEKTVSTHRTNALGKLGLLTNIDIALYAREHGLV